MPTRPASVVRARRAAVAASVAVLGGCSAETSVLDAAGPNAERIAGVWWWLFWLAVVVYAIFLAAVLAAVTRRRSTTGEGTGNLPVILGGVVLPALVLPVVLFVNFGALSDIGGRPPGDALDVEVTGNRWWWEVTYPDLGIVTANEIHIPAGRPIAFEVTSDDVIHSLWIPELMGKIDLIPGKVNNHSLMSAEPGIYRAVCAEYCGLQHTKMQLRVIVDEPGEFDAWAAAMRRPAASPASQDGRRGLDVFLEAGCGSCHTIEGTPANGELGPALTHLARRRTLAAGTIPNTRGHLAGWILNPQSVKQGALMPPIKLLPEELHALLGYLEGLE